MKFIFENQETSFYGRFTNIAICFTALLIWMMAMGTFLDYIQPPSIDVFTSKEIIVKPSFLNTFFYDCVSAPLWEEVVFRWMPLYLIRNWSIDKQIPVILGTSAIFGYMHGSIDNIWLQGVLGLGFAIVYIKNNYHYWSAVLLHSLWNFMVSFGFHLLKN